MRSVLIVLLIILFWPMSTLWAQTGFIGLYADTFGGNEQYEDTAPSLVQIHAVLMYNPGATAIQFAAPIPDCFEGAVFLADASPFSTYIGNSQTGIAISFDGQCLSSPVHVLTMMFFAQGLTNTCCMYWPVPDPATMSGQIEVVDCSMNVLYGYGVPIYISDGTYPRADNPDPPNGAIDQPLDTDLDWRMVNCNSAVCKSGACVPFSYLHFGTSPDPPFVFMTDLSWFDPGPLSPTTTYYWKAGTHADDDDAKIWSFTTRGVVPKVIVTQPYTITRCTATDTFVMFRYDTTGVTPPLDEIRGYNVTFWVDPAVATVTDVIAEIIEGPFLKAVSPTMFVPQDNGGGSYTVPCSILGGFSGATGDGDMFRVNLTPVAEGISDIIITDLSVRTVDNHPVIVESENGVLQIDCTTPWMEGIEEEEDRYYSVPPSFINFGFGDDVNLDWAIYWIDSGDPDTLFIGIDAAAWDDDGFALPAAKFDALTDGPHTVHFRVEDDGGNWSATSWGFIADRVPPTMRTVEEDQGEYHRVPPSFITFGFDDDKNLDLAEYWIDSGDPDTLFTGIDAAGWDDDGFTLPAADFDALSEGSHTITFRVVDDAGNSNTYDWQFYKDQTAPSPPSEFTALPGHNKVHLAWRNPHGDASFKGVEIRRVSWRDYPEYEAPEPSYPANEFEGLQIIVTADSVLDDLPVSPRDIYYYAAFSFDSAGNYSTFEPGAADRATNYWLGDIDSTGTVAPLNDLLVFSGTFGTAEGEPGWVPESDFGPTHNYSRFGIPEPDNVIDFEDLMIFAMNYGNVQPSETRNLLAAESPTEMKKRVTFDTTVERDREVITISVIMENKSVALKGLRMVVDHGVNNELVAVEAGGLLSGKSNHFFGTTPANAGKVDIGIAALGIGRPIEGSGEVARLVVRVETAEPIRVRLERIELRNVANEREEAELPQENDIPFVPTVSALLQNYPNPFNPSTTITFDVATAGRVTVRVYDVTGRLVRKLVDTQKPAGRYEVEWNGLDDTGSPVGSGIYFYLMTAPRYEPAAKKMLLLK